MYDLFFVIKRCLSLLLLYYNVPHANVCSIIKYVVYLNIKYVVMTSLKKETNLELSYCI
jgi:hypothetical protein